MEVIRVNRTNNFIYFPVLRNEVISSTYQVNFNHIQRCFNAEDEREWLGMVRNKSNLKETEFIVDDTDIIKVDITGNVMYEMDDKTLNDYYDAMKHYKDGDSGNLEKMKKIILGQILVKSHKNIIIKKNITLSIFGTIRSLLQMINHQQDIEIEKILSMVLIDEGGLKFRTKMGYNLRDVEYVKNKLKNIEEKEWEIINGELPRIQRKIRNFQKEIQQMNVYENEWDEDKINKKKGKILIGIELLERQKELLRLALIELQGKRMKILQNRILCMVLTVIYYEGIQLDRGNDIESKINDISYYINKSQVHGLGIGIGAGNEKENSLYDMYLVNDGQIFMGINSMDELPRYNIKDLEINKGKFYDNIYINSCDTELLKLKLNSINGKKYGKLEYDCFDHFKIIKGGGVHVFSILIDQDLDRIQVKDLSLLILYEKRVNKLFIVNQSKMVNETRFICYIFRKLDIRDVRMEVILLMLDKEQYGGLIKGIIGPTMQLKSNIEYLYNLPSLFKEGKQIILKSTKEIIRKMDSILVSDYMKELDEDLNITSKYKEQINGEHNHGEKMGILGLKSGVPDINLIDSGLLYSGNRDIRNLKCPLEVKEEVHMRLDERLNDLQRGLKGVKYPIGGRCKAYYTEDSVKEEFDKISVDEVLNQIIDEYNVGDINNDDAIPKIKDLIVTVDKENGVQRYVMNGIICEEPISSDSESISEDDNIIQNVSKVMESNKKIKNADEIGEYLIQLGREYNQQFVNQK